MKHLLTQLLLLLSVLMIFSSCGSDGPEDGVIWDIRPVGITIKLVDADGRNLLDPNVEGNWVNCPMMVGYNEKSYPAQWELPEQDKATRAIFPMFYGLIWSGVFPWQDSKSNTLYFGEFSGESNEKVEVTFAIEDLNTVYEIVYDHKIEWKKHKPHFDDHIYLNGKRYDGSSVEIVLPPREDWLFQ